MIDNNFFVNNYFCYIINRYFNYFKNNTYRAPTRDGATCPGIKPANSTILFYIY